MEIDSDTKGRDEDNYEESDEHFKSWLMNSVIPNALRENTDDADERLNEKMEVDSLSANNLYADFVRQVRLIRSCPEIWSTCGSSPHTIKPHEILTNNPKAFHPLSQPLLPSQIVSSVLPHHISHLSDDIIRTIFSHLSSIDLCRSVIPTSRRFQTLSIRSAEERIGWHCRNGHSLAVAARARDNPTAAPSVVVAESSPQKRGGKSASFVMRRTLPDCMRLLRAMEQSTIGCTFEANCNRSHRLPPFVQIPMLCLPHPVVVTGSGDGDYNGVYFCTGCNGNGFVFTKPRSGRICRPSKKSSRRGRSNRLTGRDFLDGNRNHDNIVHERGEEWEEDLEEEGDGDEEDLQYLRCIIAKKFSGEHIFWYMSKEIESELAIPNTPGDPDNFTDATATTAIIGRTKQKYSYWARLQIVGDASLSVCRYPSQTSVLCRNLGEPGWQALGGHGTVQGQPPTVELL
uniref:F-box domain-containing protein n=1 Tax=Corethron hystrix TaxID=216773 RepID=A0A7S1BW36_9STRA|mmetsp:Transcript_4331/g.8404  ORF Transcript_4331/g.8404 Transcript_4331/m.8404 type:complete len:458 (+) Transcript_4331:19-1392(+)